MKTLLRSILALAILAALVTVAAALSLSLMSSLHGTIALDGDTVTLDGFDDWRATMAIALAAVAVIGSLILAAIAVVIALVVALFAVAVALLTVIGVILLVLSPFLFIGWLVWRALRSAPAAPRLGPTVNAAS